jgi:hypothetical protein
MVKLVLDYGIYIFCVRKTYETKACCSSVLWSDPEQQYLKKFKLVYSISLEAESLVVHGFDDKRPV